MNPFLTVFIPAYNESGNLAYSVDVVRSKMIELGVDAEILIVDDASPDNTGLLADALAEKYDRLHVVHHDRNLGIGGGFVTAVQHAQGEWLILIPADLAIDPNELHLYIDASQEADVVVGLRSDRSDYTILRKIISWVNISLVQFLFGMKERQFQYICMYKLDILRAMEIEYWRSAFFHAEVLIKAKTLGGRLVEVEIKYAPRLTGRATGASLKLVLRTMRDMFRFWLRWAFLGSVKASRGA